MMVIERWMSKGIFEAGIISKKTYNNLVLDIDFINVRLKTTI